jgi:hypothetical protein
MKYENLCLNDFLEIALEILEERTNKKWRLSIHFTTELTEVRANVQAVIRQKTGEADILISGMIKFSELPKAIAHELVHLIFPELDEEKNKSTFSRKVKEIEKEIKQRLKERKNLFSSS